MCEFSSFLTTTDERGPSRTCVQDQHNSSMVISSLRALRTASRLPRKAAVELTESAAVRIKELLSLRHKVPASLPFHDFTQIAACRSWQLSRRESVLTSFHACLFHEHGSGEATHDNTMLDRS